MIPLNETHVRQTFKSWTSHYNRGRPHFSLGPGTPDQSSPRAELQIERHRIPKGCYIVSVSFWVVYITNIGLRRLRHDSPIFTDKLESINCGRQVWASDTWGHPGAFLVVQDDGNTVIFRYGQFASVGHQHVLSVISCLQFGQRAGSLNMNSYGPRFPVTSA